MNLANYLQQERGRQAALAKAIGAHAPDVSRWADGTRPIPFHFGAPIEAATNGAVTRQEMFPNEWRTYWPELATDHHHRATAPAPPDGHGGRQPPSSHNILDSVPEHSIVDPAQVKPP